MLVVLLAVLVLFSWVYMTALSEPPSFNSGPNFASSTVMVLILFILSSFTTLRTSVDENYV